MLRRLGGLRYPPRSMAREYVIQPKPAAASSGIDYAAELNEQQRAAVTAPPGPALVIAGAGSGKTRTLTYRVAYLLENGIPPWNILLLTFTNKAAREMLDRVNKLITQDVTGLWGGTFHSVGNRLLRRHAEAVGYRSGFSIMDREDQEDILGAVIGAAGIDPKDKRFPKAAVLGDIISFALNTGRPLGQVLAQKYPYFCELEDQLGRLRRKYEERKRSANCLDFDDLLVKTVELLKSDSEVAAKYRRQFQFVLVDEYQDTNHIQADFIDQLAGEHRNVMVVGDDAQSIYSWRGANFRNILDFPKRYPGAEVYKIETNYRSVPSVLSVANAAIRANVRQFEKTLQPWREAGAVKPALVPLEQSNQQATFVAQRILELREEGVDLREIAVLYRAHYHSMELQMELTRHGVPFAITSGLRFFEQAHVKDVAAFLKFVVNQDDEIAFKRMVRLLPGVGNRTADSLWSGYLKTRDPKVKFSGTFAGLKAPAKARPGWRQLGFTLDELVPGGAVARPSEMIHSVVEALYDDYMKSKFPNYEARREDLNTLMNYARQYQEAEEFLDQLALMTSLESQSEMDAVEDDEMVNLSSVHQAKGLEWRVVFVIWMTEGMFPSGRSLEDDESIEEERRLFYVAVTRARDELYLTYPHLRMNAGYGDMLQRPSRFLREIPAELLEEWKVTGGGW